MYEEEDENRRYKKQAVNFRREAIEETAIRCNVGDDQIKNEEIHDELLRN